MNDLNNSSDENFEKDFTKRPLIDIPSRERINIIKQQKKTQAVEDKNF